MTAEGRLRRGKENYEAEKFLDNSETLEYVATLEKPKEEVKVKKEKKNAKSNTR